MPRGQNQIRNVYDPAMDFINANESMSSKPWTISGHPTTFGWIGLQGLCRVPRCQTWAFEQIFFIDSETVGEAGRLLDSIVETNLEGHFVVYSPSWRSCSFWVHTTVLCMFPFLHACRLEVILWNDTISYSPRRIKTIFPHTLSSAQHDVNFTCNHYTYTVRLQ